MVLEAEEETERRLGRTAASMEEEEEEALASAVAAAVGATEPTRRMVCRLRMLASHSRLAGAGSGFIFLADVATVAGWGSIEYVGRLLCYILYMYVSKNKTVVGQQGRATASPLCMAVEQDGFAMEEEKD
ncbi:hypothetical protein U9M48_039084 [Paspalum notatum var. saurae]|uniref:Uncharacterized protein n=1 Tax=Paspalum notatum var. saurae TaxID=547442 RepID=A0AAQ3XCS5_PASNO